MSRGRLPEPALRRETQALRGVGVERADMSIPRALLAFSFLLSAAASCAAPLQNGGVEVRPGAEERLGIVCRYAGSQTQKVCDAPGDAEE